MAAFAAVARVAYLASDVVVDSHPPLPSTSEFGKTLETLRYASAHQAQIISVPAGGDAGSALARYSSPSTSLLSYTAIASSQTVNRLLVHAPELSASPVVLHLAVKDDLSDVLTLRSSVPYFLYSSTPQQAHDHALLACRIAKAERRAVVHVFDVADQAGGVDSSEENRIQSFLAEKEEQAHANGLPNGHVHAEEQDPLYKAYDKAASATSAFLGRSLHPLGQHGASGTETVAVTFGRANLDADGTSFISVSLFSPFPSAHLSASIPQSVNRIVVLEQIQQWSMKWTPFYLETVKVLQERDPRPTIISATFGDVSVVSSEELSAALSSPSTKRIYLGSHPSAVNAPAVPHVPKHESSYTKILQQLFSDRLEVVNDPSLAETYGPAATSPEFALGRVRSQLHDEAELNSAIQSLLEDSTLPEDLHSLISRWTLAKGDSTKLAALSAGIATALSASALKHPSVPRIVSLLSQTSTPKSRWIIGSDAWSYDLGASGLHHAIASGLNVNILILDTLPYSARLNGDPHRRKQDVGLYAMNHGDVFVASVAVYSSYAQVLQSLIEADRFPGPSVVLAYLPYQSDDSPALEILKETKLAVDAGYWPLYRWDPSRESKGKEPFVLDSDAIKNELQQFLDRQNHLSQLTLSKPQLASELVSNLGDKVREERKRRAQQAFDALVTAIDAPPLLVLYASDGGKAEKVAKRLAGRGKARGLSTTVATMDSVSVDDLANEEYVAFVTSVAGQGEFPQNGRQLMKALNAAATRGEKLFGKLKYSVFGMGDSHYWPRPEDAHYYNKAGKDLNARLEQLGGERFADIGLGDDQDPDGPETGYKVWEPLVWKALGVDAIEVHEAEPEPITNEHIKAASGYLRGTIAEGLEDTTTGAISPADGQLTKFHGIYQQDDRDIRDERQAQGAEPAYSFMIRVRMPGGVCQPRQWLAMDRIADERGNTTFKITTRQTFQFHGVIKRHLKPSIQAINRALLDTLAACGDVNRNVLCSAIPTLSRLHAQVYEFAKSVSEHLLPRTTAYHEIWLDKKLVAGEALKDVEPLYGEFYLPRKFKIAVAVPPTNDVDIFANDVGFIAIVDKAGDLAGFNVSIGGGMGVTHGNKKTYPRLADVIGFCTPEQGKHVAEKIMLVQRDNGNRVDRKNARLKYTIDRMGLDNFKSAVEKLLGYQLQPARPYMFDRNVDDYGWHVGEDGKHHVTLFIENGRVQDEPGRNFKTGLREIAKIHKGTFRLTANQHVMISEIAPEDVPEIKRLLREYKLDDLSHTGLRLSSSACVAFPTCGLAMAESERYLPLLIDKVEKICEENGLRNDSIVMRMTGCPNGCARPYVAEVAFVGKAPGTYLMLLGGGYYGQRLNKIYRESVSEPEILAILRPMIKRYALERSEGERFGDFVIRAGYIAPTTEGKAWYDRMGGEGEHREVSA